jgi:hypothetical protein
VGVGEKAACRQLLVWVSMDMEEHPNSVLLVRATGEKMTPRMTSLPEYALTIASEIP